MAMKPGLIEYLCYCSYLGWLDGLQTYYVFMLLFLPRMAWWAPNSVCIYAILFLSKVTWWAPNSICYAIFPYQGLLDGLRTQYEYMLFSYQGWLDGLRTQYEYMLFSYQGWLDGLQTQYIFMLLFLPRMAWWAPNSIYIYAIVLTKDGLMGTKLNIYLCYCSYQGWLDGHQTQYIFMLLFLPRMAWWAPNSICDVFLLFPLNKTARSLKLQDSSRIGCGPWNRPWSLRSLSKDSGKNSTMSSRILEARERIPAWDR